MTETIAPPPSLTLLQRAAVKRIRFFQDALKEKGIRVRLAYEQEFVVETPEGKPVLALKRDDVPPPRNSKDPHHYGVVEYLRRRGGMSSLYEIEKEYATQTQNLSNYEAKFDDREHFNPESYAKAASPLSITDDLVAFRQRGLRDALASSTCLGSEWCAGSGLLPVLRTVPYPQDAVLRQETLGLHANLSVYNKDGYNLLNFPAFEKLCAERLLEIQYHAGLGFLQNSGNLERIGINYAAPRDIGLAHDKYAGRSLLERRSEETGETYLENRMIGADADPYVVTALQLAAIYDTVQRHPGILTLPPMSRTTLRKQWPRVTTANGEGDPAMEKDLQSWKERFVHAQELRPLLGKALYEGILGEFGNRTAPPL